MRMSNTLVMLGGISAGMHRFCAGDSFLKASFEMSDGIYEIDSNSVVTKTDNAGNVEELNVNMCKGGIYPEVRISGMPIKLYVLIMIAVDPDAFEKYQSGLEINHTVISELEEPKVLNIGYNNRYDKKLVIYSAPFEGTIADPNYLEFCTRGENIKHGKFVKKFGLYNTYVSAHDLDDLEKLLIPIDSAPDCLKGSYIDSNRKNVEAYYRGKGEKKQILF